MTNIQAMYANPVIQESAGVMRMYLGEGTIGSYFNLFRLNQPEPAQAIIMHAYAQYVGMMEVMGTKWDMAGRMGRFTQMYWKMVETCCAADVMPFRNDSDYWENLFEVWASRASDMILGD